MKIYTETIYCHQSSTRREDQEECEEGRSQKGGQPKVSLKPKLMEGSSSLDPQRNLQDTSFLCGVLIQAIERGFNLLPQTMGIPLKEMGEHKEMDRRDPSLGIGHLMG